MPNFDITISTKPFFTIQQVWVLPAYPPAFEHFKLGHPWMCSAPCQTGSSISSAASVHSLPSTHRYTESSCPLPPTHVSSDVTEAPSCPHLLCSGQVLGGKSSRKTFFLLM